MAVRIVLGEVLMETTTEGGKATAPIAPYSLLHGIGRILLSLR